MTNWVVKTSPMGGQAMMAYTLNNQPDERTGQDVSALIMGQNRKDEDFNPSNLAQIPKNYAILVFVTN